MTMNNETISKALVNLAPNSEWILSGDDYSGLNWLSDGLPPTIDEIKAEIELLPEKQKAAEESFEANRQALLEKLGITADDLKVLGL